MYRVVYVLFILLAGNVYAGCDAIKPADSVGLYASWPPIETVKKEMSKDEVILLFCRQPNISREKENIIGWSFDYPKLDKKFDVFLKFDSENKYLGNLEDGLMVQTY